MSDEQEVATSIIAAAAHMAESRSRYGKSVEAMKLLEAERRMLIGPGWDMGSFGTIVQKYMPAALKFGTAIGAGGGVTALLAEPGAFGSLLQTVTGLFGG